MATIEGNTAERFEHGDDSSVENQMEAEIIQLSQSLASTVEREKREALRRARTKQAVVVSTSLAIICVIAFAAITTLNLTGYGPFSGTATSMEIQEVRAGAQRLCDLVVLRVERFRGKHGRLPSNIEELGLSAADGAVFERLDGARYRITVEHDGEVARYESLSQNGGGN